MDRQQLIDALKTLHQELSNTQELDPPTVELLETVTEDIDRLLDQAGDVGDGEKEPVTKGLQELLIRFEGRYPRFAAVIEQITDGLANLGI